MRVVAKIYSFYQAFLWSLTGQAFHCWDSGRNKIITPKQSLEEFI